MTIFLLIKPQDYQSADVEVYTDRDVANTDKIFAIADKEKNAENWVIRRVEI